MRVIIVGIHNKKGLKPLDSSTKTGKIIDLIEQGLKVPVERTNLFDVDYLPKNKKEIDNLIDQWFWENLPCEDDIIVLLGNVVRDNFKHALNNIIKVRHPRSIYSNESKNQYITDVIYSINKIQL